MALPLWAVLAYRESLAPLIALEHATPVSYTHLRAHETVLDLVCRLLLEKKKPIPPDCPVLAISHSLC